MDNKIDFTLEANGYIKVYPELTDIEITPNKETQVFKNNEEYGYDHVTVNPIPENYIEPEGSLTINENGIKDIKTYEKVIVNVPIPEGYTKPIGTLDITENGVKNIATYEKVNVNIEIPEVNLQEKSITPTKETQEVTADIEYDGLGKVTVNAIPDEYIIPDGILPITENTTYDVRKFARVSASVHPAPVLQDKSITVTENGTQTVTADSGYDGLGNVEVTTNVESSGGAYAPRWLSFYRYDGTDLDYELENVDTSNITSMRGMFERTTGITTVNLNHFNLSQITQMNELFYYSKIKSLDLSNANTSKVTTINGMFYGSSIESLNVQGWNISNVTDMAHMFNYAQNAIELDLSGLNTSKVTTLENTFSNMTKLTKLNLSGWNTSSIKATLNMFNGTKNLTTLIIDSPTVFKLANSSSLTNSAISNGKCIIYVPDDLVNSYKSANYWSAYPNQIKGLSELPEE